MNGGPYRGFVDANVPVRPLKAIKPEPVVKEVQPYKSFFANSITHRHLLDNLVYVNKIDWNQFSMSLDPSIGSTVIKIPDVALEVRRGSPGNWELLEFLREKDEELFDSYFDENLVSLSEHLC